jgi:hypothetical protein
MACTAITLLLPIISNLRARRSVPRNPATPDSPSVEPIRQ